jgi:hypothetical protein
MTPTDVADSPSSGLIFPFRTRRAVNSGDSAEAHEESSTETTGGLTAARSATARKPEVGRMDATIGDSLRACVAERAILKPRKHGLQTQAPPLNGAGDTCKMPTRSGMIRRPRGVTRLLLRPFSAAATAIRNCAASAVVAARRRGNERLSHEALRRRSSSRGRR